MSRKIKVQTVNTDNLEKILKENICTKTLESGISPALIEKTRKLMDKLREEDNNPCNNDNTGDAFAYTKSNHLSEEDIKTFVNDTSKEILNKCDDIDKVTVNDVLKENSISRSNINKENKEDIKKSCITAKNLITDVSSVKPKTHDKFLKHYGNVSTGEFVISIPQDYETTMEEVNNMENNNTKCNKHYEEVNHPDHYNVYDVEVVEMMERIFGIEETMSWCKLNAFKYRMRAGEKPTSTVEKDLKKEKWCLNKYKELKSKN